MRAVASGVIVSVLLVGGCSNDGDDDPAEAPADAAVVDDETVTATSDPPRAAGFTPAREDITALTCRQDGDAWEVVGTVENPTDAPADYRIYTLLLDDAEELKGIAQADVAGVGAAEAKDWTASIDLPLDDLHCGVRVERTPAG